MWLVLCLLWHIMLYMLLLNCIHLALLLILYLFDILVIFVCFW